MLRRIAIIQGHPDPAGHHLLHAMADAYAEAAIAAGHEVRSIDVAKLEFPLLRTQEDFEPSDCRTAGRGVAADDRGETTPHATQLGRMSSSAIGGFDAPPSVGAEISLPQQ